MNIEPVTVRLPVGDDPPTARLYYGQAVLETLKELPAGSVHVACTSPPYWGLRDYGVPPQDWPAFSYAPVPGLPEIEVPAQQVALGLEEDPFHFIGHLVLVFRELRRVLRDDGTLWLNLGDSYVGHHGNSRVPDGEAPSNKPGYVENMRKTTVGVAGLKAKDLTLIPHRAALALQADGWWVRNDVVWAKPSCMPESVTDRCTRNHEYVFMLAKSKRYFYDRHAILEPFADDRMGRDGGKQDRERNRGGRKDGFTKPNDIDPSIHGGKNKRTVWSVSTKPYPGAHFAVWPPELVTPMVKAGTSEHGVCGVCAAPWKRVAEGWEPTCKCENNDASGRAVVLDPFSGSATTGMVALNLGRDYIGIDLNPAYLEMAKARVVGNPPSKESETVEDGSVLDLFGV